MRVDQLVSNGCFRESFAPECLTEYFQIYFEVWGRWPLPLRHPQQIIDRRRVIGSPVVHIMNRSSMARTIRAVLPAQVLLHMRLRSGLHGDVHLGEIAQEDRGLRGDTRRRWEPSPRPRRDAFVGGQANRLALVVTESRTSFFCQEIHQAENDGIMRRNSVGSTRNVASERSYFR